MNIKPLFDKVVVESVNVEEKTKSGFFLPSSAQEKPQTCVVVAVGPGGIIDGKEIQMQVKVGDKVLAPNMRARNSRLTARNLQSLNKATFSPSSKTDFNKRKYRIISYKEINYHG